MECRTTRLVALYANCRAPRPSRNGPPRTLLPRPPARHVVCRGNHSSAGGAGYQRSAPPQPRLPPRHALGPAPAHARCGMEMPAQFRSVERRLRFLQRKCEYSSQLLGLRALGTPHEPHRQMSHLPRLTLTARTSGYMHSSIRRRTHPSALASIVPGRLVIVARGAARRHSFIMPLLRALGAPTRDGRLRRGAPARRPDELCPLLQARLVQRRRLSVAGHGRGGRAATDVPRARWKQMRPQQMPACEMRRSGEGAAPGESIRRAGRTAARRAPRIRLQRWCAQEHQEQELPSYLRHTQNASLARLAASQSCSASTLRRSILAPDDGSSRRRRRTGTQGGCGWLHRIAQRPGRGSRGASRRRRAAGCAPRCCAAGLPLLPRCTCCRAAAPPCASRCPRHRKRSFGACSPSSTHSTCSISTQREAAKRGTVRARTQRPRPCLLLRLRCRCAAARYMLWQA